MRELRLLLLLVVVGLAATGCTVEPGTFPSQLEPLALPDAPAPTPRFGLLADRGVEDAACPDATNPDNGCIHLGALVDLSGPFAPFGQAALAGARAYWEHVNEQGGVSHKDADGIEAAFDVELGRWVADDRHDVPTHLDELAALEPNVLALALSMGTAMTVEALPDHIRTDMVAAPLGWWSGWSFEELITESGASYCFQAINGMDWALAQLGGGTPIDHVVVVHAPGRYGEDVLHGVEYWTDPDGSGGSHPRVPFERAEHAVVVEPGGDVAQAVDRIVEVSPDVVVLAVDPQVTADVARETAARGWDGLLVGMAPTFEPSLLDDRTIAELLEDRFVRIGNVGPLTQGGRAYTEMRESLGLGEDRRVDPSAPALPANDAWVAGWVAQYPVHRAMKEAIAHGDLTRAGLVHELDGLTVKYDGALPWTTYGGVPNDEATRRTFVFRPARDGVLGQDLVGDAYVGRTAERRYLLRPCTEG